MRDLPRTLVVRVSSLYDTDPVGEVDQPAFLNCGVWPETARARELLWRSSSREADGPRAVTALGPRPIDLDPSLLRRRDHLPTRTHHYSAPGAHRRAFVLLPLQELDPDFVHPSTGESIKKLIKRLQPRSVKAGGSVVTCQPSARDGALHRGRRGDRGGEDQSRRLWPSCPRPAHPGGARRRIHPGGFLQGSAVSFQTRCSSSSITIPGIEGEDAARSLPRGS